MTKGPQLGPGVRCGAVPVQQSVGFCSVRQPYLTVDLPLLCCHCRVVKVGQARFARMTCFDACPRDRVHRLHGPTWRRDETAGALCGQSRLVWKPGAGPLEASTVGDGANLQWSRFRQGGLSFHLNKQPTRLQ